MVEEKKKIEDTVDVENDATLDKDPGTTTEPLLENVNLVDNENDSKKEEGSKEEISKEEDGSVDVLAPEPVALEDIDVEETPVPDSKDSESKPDEDADVPALPTRKASEPKENPILKQLTEAFPNIEEKYVKAIIIASKGMLDPAFNALLYLSDPESNSEIQLPSKPPTPLPQVQNRKNLSQLEQDELLAKQLNDRYNKSQNRQRRKGSTHSRRGKSNINYNEEPILFDANERQLHAERLSERRRRLQETGEFNPETYNDDDDSWAQFVERDIPDITAKANKSIQETASKVSNWFNRNFMTNESSNNDYNNDASSYGDAERRQQQRELNYYENQRSQRNGAFGKNENQSERRRFNSFGARAGEGSLESHGITLNNDEFSDDEDVPPQLPRRERSNAHDEDPDEANTSIVTNNSQRVVSQTTYIDTPDKATKKKWQPLPPEPIDATPTKVNATTNKNEADEDDFLINSDDD